VVRERAERHWWLKNAGFKLVAGKFIFRSQKIGGSRKLNWWLRNFRPLVNVLPEFLAFQNPFIFRKEKSFNKTIKSLFLFYPIHVMLES
jgi:hypothetical protein